MEGLEKCYSGRGSSIRFDRNCTGYTLPTEAEWEYAAKGGETFMYSGSNNVDEVAWYRDNSSYETHPVGEKKENGNGLYDMSGNVYEWVWDLYGRYSSVTESDLTGVTESSNRVLCGGYYNVFKRYVRISHRYGYDPSVQCDSNVFRLRKSDCVSKKYELRIACRYVSFYENS